MFETIRQFAEEQLAAIGSIVAVRDRHAASFAAQAVAHWDIWDGPRHRVGVDWVEAEFANLRAGFRWAADHRDDLVTATAIAAHTALLAFDLVRLESVGSAEELLAAATAADVRQLPRLYSAASIGSYSGRPEIALGYAHRAGTLGTDPRYDGFPPGVSSTSEGVGHLYAGRIDRCLELWAGMAADPQPGLRRFGVWAWCCGCHRRQVGTTKPDGSPTTTSPPFAPTAARAGPP
jgi:hypothetical protein